jgi:hypothetical protein
MWSWASRPAEWGTGQQVQGGDTECIRIYSIVGISHRSGLWPNIESGPGPSMADNTFSKGK